jgi:hypothetical protein
MIPTTSSLFLSAEHATTALLRGGLALHLLRDLDVDLEELAHAAVEADGLALVEVGFAVLGRNALLGAGVDEPGERENQYGMVSYASAMCAAMNCKATYWLNMPETISISASAAAIFSAEEG